MLKYMLKKARLDFTEGLMDTETDIDCENLLDTVGFLVCSRNVDEAQTVIKKLCGNQYYEDDSGDDESDQEDKNDGLSDAEDGNKAFAEDDSFEGFEDGEASD